MPVLYGAGVEQFLWMANHPLLYDGDGIADFDIRFKIRNGAGEIVFEGRETLPKGAAFRHDLSRHLDSGEALAVGSIQLDRFAKQPGVRGTTRPQIEVVTRKAAASLHFQAPTQAYDKVIAVRPRPGEERLLLTAVNCSRRTLEVTVDIAPPGSREAIAVMKRTIAPFAAELIEPSISAAAFDHSIGGLLELRFRTNGFGKLHIVSAVSDLSRLSLDHL